MQENANDYYAEEGCCLTCKYAEPGCMCYKCRCRKCYWYYYDESREKGFCEHLSSSFSKNEWGNDYADNIWIGNIQKETEKGLYCELVDDKKDIIDVCWVPKSVLISASKGLKGAIIKNWWLEKKGIVTYD